jgi:tRNA-specific 2-thiouridylase
LSRSLFPIGELQKSEVRAIARQLNLVTADKKDSQGLCFFGKVHLPDFLKQRLQTQRGEVVEVPANAEIFSVRNEAGDLQSLSSPYELAPELGEIVGAHQGAHYYTIGQRKGLKLGGFDKPLFVIGTDTQRNIIYAGMGEDHPGLYRRGLFIPAADEHWIREDLRLAVGEQKKFLTRIRYRQPLSPATLHRTAEGIYIIFDQPQKSITPGQFAAWYDGEELIGSGVIS